MLDSALASVTALAHLPAHLPAHLGGPGPGPFGWLFVFVPLLWASFFVLLFVFARRRAERRGLGPFGAGVRSAEGSLAERFAQGDIDEVEYRSRLEVLRAARARR